jgi:hypothetical protein
MLWIHAHVLRPSARCPERAGGEKDPLVRLDSVHFCAVSALDTEADGRIGCEVVAVLGDRRFVDECELEGGRAEFVGWAGQLGSLVLHPTPPLGPLPLLCVTFRTMTLTDLVACVAGNNGRATGASVSGSQSDCCMTVDAEVRGARVS